MNTLHPHPLWELLVAPELDAQHKVVWAAVIKSLLTSDEPLGEKGFHLFWRWLSQEATREQSDGARADRQWLADELCVAFLRRLPPLWKRAGDQGLAVFSMMARIGARMGLDRMLTQAGCPLHSELEMLAIDGLPLLSYATAKDDLRCIELFCERGFSPAIQSSDGKTPLFFATSKQAVEQLLAAGANLLHKDQSGSVALSCWLKDTLYQPSQAASWLELWKAHAPSVTSPSKERLDGLFSIQALLPLTALMEICSILGVDGHTKDEEGRSLATWLEQRLWGEMDAAAPTEVSRKFTQTARALSIGRMFCLAEAEPVPNAPLRRAALVSVILGYIDEKQQKMGMEHWLRHSQWPEPTIESLPSVWKQMCEDIEGLPAIPPGASGFRGVEGWTEMAAASAAQALLVHLLALKDAPVTVPAATPILARGGEDAHHLREVLAFALHTAAMHAVQYATPAATGERRALLLAGALAIQPGILGAPDFEWLLPAVLAHHSHLFRDKGQKPDELFGAQASSLNAFALPAGPTAHPLAKGLSQLLMQGELPSQETWRRLGPLFQESGFHRFASCVDHAFLSALTPAAPPTNRPRL